MNANKLTDSQKLALFIARDAGFVFSRGSGLTGCKVSGVTIKSLISRGLLKSTGFGRASLTEAGRVHVQVAS